MCLREAGFGVEHVLQQSLRANRAALADNEVQLSRNSMQLVRLKELEEILNSPMGLMPELIDNLSPSLQASANPREGVNASVQACMAVRNEDA